MTDADDLERLTRLVQAALDEADRQNETLVAALLGDCAEALRQPRFTDQQVAIG